MWRHLFDEIAVSVDNGGHREQAFTTISRGNSLNARFIASIIAVPPSKWPPDSPDLNPMDYFMWGVVESRSNRVAPATKAALIEAIKRAFNNCHAKWW